MQKKVSLCLIPEPIRKEKEQESLKNAQRGARRKKSSISDGNGSLYALGGSEGGVCHCAAKGGKGIAKVSKKKRQCTR